MYDDSISVKKGLYLVESASPIPDNAARLTGRYLGK